MIRSALVEWIEHELGARQLFWFGTRGSDAEALGDLPQFAGSFSLIGSLRSRPSVRSMALEEISRSRPDLDMYDIDDHLRSAAVAEFRGVILRALARPSALVTYRPTLFSSAIGFSRQERCLSLGMFKGIQSAFEHKPWLETSIAQLDLPAIRWRYIPDRELLDAGELVAEGPVMLRRSRTTGGVGLVKVSSVEELERLWPEEDEAYVSVSRYIEGGMPINVGGVVWDDGGVTVHRASVQLIGVPALTTRPFGYCGNDFVTAARLEKGVLQQIDDSTRAIGSWLGRSGYVGAFGIDFLLVDGQPLFTEVNPRFQGSTHLSCQLSVERGESCLLLEHVAACLGFPAPPSRPLRDQMADDVDLAQIVVHNVGGSALSIDPPDVLDIFRALDVFNRADVVTSDGLVTEPGGTVARISLRSSVTETGFDLRPPWAELALDMSPQPVRGRPAVAEQPPMP
jgi:ATP-grasp domain